MDGYVLEKPESDIYNPLPIRTDLDFTDLVWNYIQSATSPQEVSSIISAICDELAGGFEPYVAKRYNSWFARTIRECLDLSKQETNKDKEEQRESIQRAFDSWTQQPFQVMVEMGLEVLRQDYIFHLVGIRN
jgi:hypothetical protein